VNYARVFIFIHYLFLLLFFLFFLLGLPAQEL